MKQRAEKARESCRDENLGLDPGRAAGVQGFDQVAGRLEGGTQRFRP